MKKVQLKTITYKVKDLKAIREEPEKVSPSKNNSAQWETVILTNIGYRDGETLYGQIYGLSTLCYLMESAPRHKSWREAFGLPKEQSSYFLFTEGEATDIESLKFTYPVISVKVTEPAYVPFGSSRVFQTGTLFPQSPLRTAGACIAFLYGAKFLLGEALKLTKKGSGNNDSLLELNELLEKVKVARFDKDLRISRDITPLFRNPADLSVVVNRFRAGEHLFAKAIDTNSQYSLF